LRGRPDIPFDTLILSSLPTDRWRHQSLDLSLAFAWKTIHPVRPVVCGNSAYTLAAARHKQRFNSRRRVKGLPFLSSSGGLLISQLTLHSIPKQTSCSVSRFVGNHHVHVNERHPVSDLFLSSPSFPFPFLNPLQPSSGAEKTGARRVSASGPKYPFGGGLDHYKIAGDEVAAGSGVAPTAVLMYSGYPKVILTAIQMRRYPCRNHPTEVCFVGRFCKP
jgi:hypothetical protein